MLEPKVNDYKSNRKDLKQLIVIANTLNKNVILNVTKIKTFFSFYYKSHFLRTLNKIKSTMDVLDERIKKWDNILSFGC